MPTKYIYTCRLYTNMLLFKTVQKRFVITARGGEGEGEGWEQMLSEEEFTPHTVIRLDQGSRTFIESGPGGMYTCIVRSKTGPIGHIGHYAGE